MTTVAPQNIGLAPSPDYTPTTTAASPVQFGGPGYTYEPGTIAPQNAGLPAPGYYYTPTAPPPTGGGGGGGAAAPEIDYALLVAGMFDYLGLPEWIRNKLIDIFRNTPDPQQAAMIALGFIRGTDWYKQAFPGINVGIKAGLFQDERGYRSYVNQIGTLYKQYGLGAPSGDTITGIIGEGITPDIVGKRLEGGAIQKAYAPDWQYLAGAFGQGHLSGGELTTLGRQQAGLGSELGAKLERQIGLATQRMRRLFEGTLAAPSLTLGQGGRLAAPALSGGRAQADIGA